MFANRGGTRPEGDVPHPMDLLSVQFGLMLAIAAIAYYALGRLAPRHQWILLLACSIGFYYLMAGLPALGLMLATSVDIWAAGLALDHIEQAGKTARKQTKDRNERKALKAKTVRNKRLALILALLIPVGILGYFKYANVVLFNFGLAPSPTSLGILLPLGISFYTFQSLGYLIDSYNAKYQPERSFPRFLLFVSWFPQIIQGPIGRYDQLQGQLTTIRTPDVHGIRKGLVRLGYGALKKIAIANVLSANVNAVFGRVTNDMPGSIVIFGVLAYSVQMYADFSGGIDIVSGASEIFGIKLAQNFRQPYLSTSLADFWRRWHMSLGSWMRDYIFYPFALLKPMQAFGKWTRAHLSTHVGRTLPACIANVVVFIFVGLWHGADWHYVAWGLYNGLVVALSDLFAPAFKRLGERLHINVQSRAFYVFAVVRTFLVVNVGRLFDCVTDVRDSFTCINAICTNMAPVEFKQALWLWGIENGNTFGFSSITIIACIVVVIVDILSERGIDVRERLLSLPYLVRLGIYLVCAFLVFAALDYTIMREGNGFLYANF